MKQATVVSKFKQKESWLARLNAEPEKLRVGDSVITDRTGKDNVLTLESIEENKNTGSGYIATARAGEIGMQNCCASWFLKVEVKEIDEEVYIEDLKQNGV